MMMMEEAGLQQQQQQYNSNNTLSECRLFIYFITIIASQINIIYIINWTASLPIIIIIISVGIDIMVDICRKSTKRASRHKFPATSETWYFLIILSLYDRVCIYLQVCKLLSAETKWNDFVLPLSRGIASNNANIVTYSTLCAYFVRFTVPQ